MSLSENLQNLRKIKSMSQEELAEKLNVSRQAISKWESGSGYPETEKIISICEFFDCSMDELVKGKISENIKNEKDNYDLVMTKTTKNMIIAYGIILLGIAIMLTVLGCTPNRQLEDQYALIGVIVVLISVIFAVPLFIINGTKVDEFMKKNPKIANVYSEEEVDRAKAKYSKFMALGICIILIGVVIMMLLFGLEVFEQSSTIPAAILMYLITIGLPIIVFSAKMQDKYDIEKYNKENTEEYKKNRANIRKICAIIILITTIVFLITLNMWNINWIVYPIGAILCLIVAIVMKKR